MRMRAVAGRASHLPPAPAQPAWGVPLYRLSTSGSNLTDVLRDLSSATGVPIAVGSHLTGTVEGRFDLAPQRFLDLLANAYGLVWYYDGSVLHVDAAADQRSLTLRLHYAQPAALHALLNGIGATDPRFPLVDNTPSTGLVSVRGPAAYIALVEKLARQVDGAARAKVVTAVRMVSLHYAEATDRLAQTNDRTTTVEGVATEARRLLDPPANREVEVTDYEAPLPVIAADARTNSVLIRDRPQRLDADVRAVAALDRSSLPVILDVLIADVQSSALPLLSLGNVQPRMSGAVIVDNDGATLRDRLRQMETTQAVHIHTDNQLSTVDHVAAALEQRLDWPVAVSGHATHPDAPAVAMSLRIVPTVAQGTRSPAITLAVELRNAANIDVTRRTLGPHQGIVLVVPDEGQGNVPRGASGSWLVMLVPHAAD